MATVTKASITSDEFMMMDLGEGLHELVRGEVITSPPPAYSHGYVCGNVYAKLREFGRQTGLGHSATNDSIIRISNNTVRGADVCYYREDQRPRALVGQGLPPVPPDLVAEVVSPGYRLGDIVEKVGEYLSAGISLVWVVYPKRRSLTIYRADDELPIVLNEGDVLEGLPELPGFRCVLSEFLD